MHTFPNENLHRCREFQRLCREAVGPFSVYTADKGGSFPTRYTMVPIECFYSRRVAWVAKICEYVKFTDRPLRGVSINYFVGGGGYQ